MKWEAIRKMTILGVAGFVLLAPTALMAGRPVVKSGEAQSADGAKIAYQVWGTKDPTLVFVHGWSCNSSVWDAQVPVFAGKYRVVTLDLAGHGKSARTRKAWTVTNFGEDVRAVVKAVKAKTVVLVGHSMGGPVILEAARLLNPDVAVAGLVPVDTLQDLDRKLPEEQIKAFLEMMRNDFPGTSQMFIDKYLFTPKVDPAVKKRVLDLMLAADPTTAITLMDALVHYDPRGWVSALNVPIRCLNTDLNPTNAEVNRKYFKDYEVIILKGYGHFPMMEAPAEFNAVLQATLDKLPRQAGR